MEGGNMHSDDVLTLRSVSIKFSQVMLFPLHLLRPLFDNVLSCIESLSTLTEITTKVYGSIGEGLCYPFEIVDYRDADAVYVYPKMLADEIAYENDLNEQEIYVYLVDREGTLPGYCRLRQLYHGSSLLSHMHITKELNGINYLLNTCPKDLQERVEISEGISSYVRKMNGIADFALGALSKRGPSISREVRELKWQFWPTPLAFNITKFDFVFVINHPKWPSWASDWSDRKPRYGWPSKQQIQNIMNKGIYLAPVGSIQSELKDIEWRYSFNEAERELVRSFNSTQINCYVLLKMLVSESMKKCFDDDVISSYHIKTLMFWEVEQTDPMLWVPQNLVELIFRILDKLLVCVKKLYCPSYFIPEENLFAGKITPVNMEPVSQILSEVKNEGWVALTKLKHFAKNEQFVQSLYKDNDIVDHGELEKLRLSNLHIANMNHYFNSGNTVICIDELLYPISCCSLIETDKMHENFNEVIKKLLQRINLSDNDINKEMLQNILAFVRCTHMTHFLSLSLCPSLERRNNCIMDKIGLDSKSHDCRRNLVECIAKHANYTYMTGDFQLTIEAANQLLDRYASFPFHPPGVARNSQAHFHSCLATAVNYIINGKNVSDLFDKHCFLGWIIFLKNEIYALPGDARVELFCVISTGNQLQTMWRNLFGLSPFLYVAYLAFLINFDRGFEQEAKVYLKRMESICRNSNSYELSSLNLLGASYIKLGQYEKAMKMFRISMKRQREEANSAAWHVSRLLWRKLRDRWTEYIYTRNSK